MSCESDQRIDFYVDIIDHKVYNKLISRMVNDMIRRVDLVDTTFLHNHNPVR